VPTEEAFEELREQIAVAYGVWAGIAPGANFKSKDKPYTGGSPTLDALLAELEALQQTVVDDMRTGELGADCDFGATPNGSPNLTGLTKASWGEYVFFFEHLDGTTSKVCGSSSDETYPPGGEVVQWGMDTWVAGIGGTSKTGDGMPMHVSCSLNFIDKDGWDDENKLAKFGDPPRLKGPVEGLDTEWHVVQYIGARWELANGNKELKIDRGDNGTKVELPKTSGQVYLKHACNYAFTAVTSSFVPTIRLSD
jgi:hypothetical protein